jgi:hypothetical protein
LAGLPGLALGQGSASALVADRLADGASEPVIDGRVVEEVWLSAVAYAHFTQQDPREGEPATERTEVRVLVGRGNLYISVICFDSDPSRIIAAQSRRDAALTDVDSVIVALDTFNDSQNAFIFGTNALGIQYDGQVACEGQTSGVQSNAGVSPGQPMPPSVPRSDRIPCLGRSRSKSPRPWSRTRPASGSGWIRRSSARSTSGSSSTTCG